MNAASAYHLLGRLEDGNLILLAGPNYIRVRELANASGIPFTEAVNVAGPEDAENLKARVAQSGESYLVIASMPEVEGILDRSAFDGRLTDLAYAADWVVYAGLNGTAVVYPAGRATCLEVLRGEIKIGRKVELPTVAVAAQ